jgi:hypothetical protein
VVGVEAIHSFVVLVIGSVALLASDSVVLFVIDSVFVVGSDSVVVVSDSVVDRCRGFDRKLVKKFSLAFLDCSRIMRFLAGIIGIIPV